MGSSLGPASVPTRLESSSMAAGTPMPLHTFLLPYPLPSCPFPLLSLPPPASHGSITRSRRNLSAPPHAIGNPHHVLVAANSSGHVPLHQAVSTGDDSFTSFSCPLPDPASSSICLFNPCNASDQNIFSASSPSDRPLFIYVPGMDCTGQGISTQIPSLLRSG